MEPPRWELKIPLRVLCILSDDTERMGLPDLRARGKIDAFQVDRRGCAPPNLLPICGSLTARL